MKVNIINNENLVLKQFDIHIGPAELLGILISFTQRPSQSQATKNALYQNDSITMREAYRIFLKIINRQARTHVLNIPCYDLRPIAMTLKGTWNEGHFICDEVTINQDQFNQQGAPHIETILNGINKGHYRLHADIIDPTCIRTESMISLCFKHSKSKFKNQEHSSRFSKTTIHAASKLDPVHDNMPKSAKDTRDFASQSLLLLCELQKSKSENLPNTVFPFPDHLKAKL